MIKSNRHRVRYLEANDLMFGYMADNLRKLVKEKNKSIVSINDALEVYEGKRILGAYPDLFGEDSAESSDTLKGLFARACICVKDIVENDGVIGVYNNLEAQYASVLWEGLSAFGAIDLIEASEISKLLEVQPGILSAMIKEKHAVKKFDAELSTALMENESSAELIIRGCAVDDMRNRIFLPKSLGAREVEGIFDRYLSTERATNSYVSIIAGWPSNNLLGIKLSRRICTKAEKLLSKLDKELLSSGIILEYSASVVFSKMQKACKGFKVSEGSFAFVYGVEWLEKYTDFATIMNNFIFVFEIMSGLGLLNMPAQKHGASSLLRIFELHPINEYKKDEGFDARNAQFAGAIGMYSELLNSNSVRLESAIEWVFDEYFRAEYGIDGFSLKLPTPETSWHDKCKSIGPEIERIVKAFQLYVEDGEIDALNFKHMTVSDFASIPSLIKKKYYVEGAEFDKVAHALFSNQSSLSCPETGNGDDDSFFDLVRKRNLGKSDFPDFCHSAIDWLIGEEFMEEVGFHLKPTLKCCLLNLVWRHGSIPRIRLEEPHCLLADELVDEGYVSASSCLLAPNEADYYNYMFGNRHFTNSAALRNKYDHASLGLQDFDDSEYKADYFRLLLLVIGLALKINDELSYMTKKGGVEDFIDWPLVDESAMEEIGKLSSVF